MAAEGDLDEGYRAAAAAIRGARGVLVVSHENPDGDAIGSTLAAVRSLAAAGIAADAWLGGAIGLPQELVWLGVEAIERGELPAPDGRLLLALDCASAPRITREPEQLEGWAGIVNIDHHHDNTAFGDVNVIDADAACTTLMVHRLLGELGAPVTPEVALPLYVGAVTDSGRFAYSNTSPTLLRFAADLVELGVDPHEVFTRIYEGVPLAKTLLLGRALTSLRMLAGGRLALTVLTRADFAATDARDPFSEGVIDHLRSIEGVRFAALVREPREGPARYKVSLRAAREDVDVSAIAREYGGGGHVQAAGFSTDLDLAELVPRLEAEAARG